MSSPKELNSLAVAPISRRDLFLGAGMTAGAIAALGAAGAAYTPAALAAVKNRQYFSTFVNFELDGAFAGRLLSAEGGEPVLVPSTTAVGAERSTTALSLRYEPLTLKFGDMSPAVFDWVGKASTNAASGRSAAVVTHDFAGKEVYRLSMQNARLIDVMFDAFDASKTGESTRITVKIQPGQSSHDLSAKAAYKGEVFKSSPLLAQNFRLYIQGVDTATTKARLIDQLGVQARPDGLLVPTPLRFTVAMGFAAPLFAWMNDTLAGKVATRPGELQLLSRDLSQVAASISFDQLTILRISSPLDATGEKSTQQVEVECLPAATRFNMGELLK